MKPSGQCPEQVPLFPTISAKPVLAGAASQRLILAGERSGLQTHIGTTESAAFSMPMKS